jgi:hypothetical protein
MLASTRFNMIVENSGGFRNLKSTQKFWVTPPLKKQMLHIGGEAFIVAY